MTYHHSQIGGECHTTASRNETKTGTSYDHRHRPSRTPHSHRTVVPHSYEGQSDDLVKHHIPTTPNNIDHTCTKIACAIPMIAPPRVHDNAPQPYPVETKSNHQAHPHAKTNPQRTTTTRSTKRHYDTEDYAIEEHDIRGSGSSDTLTRVRKCQHTKQKPYHTDHTRTRHWTATNTSHKTWHIIMAITRDKKNEDNEDRDLSKVKIKSSEVTDDESIDENTLTYNMERLRRFIVPAQERQGVMKSIFKTIKNNPTFNKDLNRKLTKTLENQAGNKTFALSTLWKTYMDIKDVIPTLKGMREENNTYIVSSPLSQQANFAHIFANFKTVHQKNLKPPPDDGKPKAPPQKPPPEDGKPKAQPTPPEDGKPNVQQIDQKQQTKIPPDADKQKINDGSTIATASSTIQTEEIVKTINTMTSNKWNQMNHDFNDLYATSTNNFNNTVQEGVHLIDEHSDKQIRNILKSKEEAINQLQEARQTTMTALEEKHNLHKRDHNGVQTTIANLQEQTQALVAKAKKYIRVLTRTGDLLPEDTFDVWDQMEAVPIQHVWSLGKKIKQWKDDADSCAQRMERHQNELIAFRNESKEEISALTRSEDSFSTKIQAMEEKINQLETQILLAHTPHHTTASTTTTEQIRNPPQVPTKPAHTPPQTSTPTQPVNDYAGTYTSVSGEPYIPPQNPHNRYPENPYPHFHPNQYHGYSPQQTHSHSHMQPNNTYRINAFNKSICTVKLKIVEPHEDSDVVGLGFYNQFHAYAISYQVGLKPFMELGPSVNDYYAPSALTMTVEEQMQERQANATILATKLLQAVEDQHIVTYLSRDIRIANDGYEMMKWLMRHHLPQLRPQRSYHAIPEKPVYSLNTDILTFQSRYTLWLQVELQAGRKYKEKDHFTYFLHQLRVDDRYKEAIQEAERACPVSQQDVPPEYTLMNIAHTLLDHHSLRADGDLDAIQPQNRHMQFQNQYSRISAAEAKRPTKRDDKPRRRQQRRPTREDIQCDRCQLYGHRGSKCSLFTRMYWCLKYMNNNPQDAAASAKNFKSNNTPSAKAALKATINNAFACVTGLPEDIAQYSEEDLERYELFAETFADQHIEDPDQGHINTVHDHRNDTTNQAQVDHNETTGDSVKDIIHRLTTTTETTGDEQLGDEQLTQDYIKHLYAPTNVIIPPIPDFMTQDQLLHSNDMDICRPCQDDEDTTPVDNTSHGAYIQVLNETHESQSDTGANRHLTNRKEVIKNFKPCEPFNIGTIEQDTTVKVTGSGMTSIQTTDPQNPLIYETLYSPKASGSVFSPEKYAHDNKDTIRMWSQIGDTQTRKGAITFYGHDKNNIINIPLYPRNGLWYMKIQTPE